MKIVLVGVPDDLWEDGVYAHPRLKVYYEGELDRGELLRAIDEAMLAQEEEL
jgi:hypothetical protein